MRSSQMRRLMATVALLATAVACTDDAPDEAATPTPAATSPSPAPAATGERVTVIIGPPSHVAAAEADALRRAATALAEDLPPGVAALRVVQAESEAFTFDLVDLAVDAGVDVVCIVGTGAAPLLLEAASTRRDARFCGTDSRVEGGPVNILTVAVDPTALVQVGTAALGRAPAPLGFLVSDVLGDPAALTTVFTDSSLVPTQPLPEPTPAPTPEPTSAPETDASATSDDPASGPAPDAADDAAATRQGTAPATTSTPDPTPTPAPSATPAPAPSPTPTPTPTPVPTPTPTPDPPDPSPSPAPPAPVDAFAAVTITGGQQSTGRGAEELAESGPSRALLLVTPGSDLAAAPLTAAGAAVVVVADWAVDGEGALPGGLLAGLTVDWGVLLRQAVEAALDDESGQVQLLGLADGVLGALPGQVEGAAAAVERVVGRLGEAVAAAEAAASPADGDEEPDETSDG